jgi:integrase
LRRQRTKEPDHPADPTTTAVLEVWLAERAGHPDEPAFPTARGGRLTRDALDHRITKYIDIAAQRCSTLHEKRITPHTLRHTAAMRLLLLRAVEFRHVCAVGRRDERDGYE